MKSMFIAVIMFFTTTATTRWWFISIVVIALVTITAIAGFFYVMTISFCRSHRHPWYYIRKHILLWIFTLYSYRYFNLMNDAMIMRMPVIIRNFEAKEVKMSIIAGIMNEGITDIFINAPIEIKNIAENTSLRGIVSTLTTAALLDSATNTPAKKAPITTDSPRSFAANDSPNAKPRITISSNS